MEVAQTILILVGCALSLPIYWWLFIHPWIRLISRRLIRKTNVPLQKAEPIDERATTS